MIHLQLGKASSLQMGRPGEDTWWVVKGCSPGQGPCVGPLQGRSSQTSPWLFVLQEAWGNESGTEMLSGLPKCVWRPQTSEPLKGSLFVFALYISWGKLLWLADDKYSGYWLSKRKSQTSASDQPSLSLPLQPVSSGCAWGHRLGIYQWAGKPSCCHGASILLLGEEGNRETQTSKQIIWGKKMIKLII